MGVSDVPPALRERLGTEATVSLLELFETARQEWIPEVTTAAVERFERRLGDEVGSLRLEMRDGFATLRQEMQSLETRVREEMHSLETGLRQEMHSMETGLRRDMQSLETGLRQEMQTADGSLRDEIAQLRLEVREGFAKVSVENAEARFELLKWAFMFWVGQVFAVGGVMALVLRLSRV
jgi:hypothetical protein